MPIERLFFLLGAVSGLVGVGAGAFGAHELDGRLTALGTVETFDTAVRYHLVHAVALLVVGWAAGRWPGTAPVLAGWMFVVGTLLFSGSLYILSLTGVRWLAAITPFGGAAFLVGWGALIWAALQNT